MKLSMLLFGKKKLTCLGKQAGHRPVIVKRAVIGSKGGWKLSTIFKL